MPETLYVIGNGFDLYHEMKTSYSDFCRFVKRADSNVFYRIERYLPLFENWSNLEEALGSIDLDQIIDDASQVLMSYGAENWSDSGHHDYQYEIQQSVIAVSSQLVDHLQKWISQVPEPDISHLNESSFSFDSEAKFLNFNYTQTLQNSYRINTDRVLHIHGDVSFPILGHAWSPEDITPEWLSYSDEDMDTRVIEGNEILKPIFQETFKPTAEIIQENLLWFQSLKSIESIYVFGHSLSEVDSAYFHEIFRQVSSQKTIWNISYYHASELGSHKKFIKSLGVSASLVKYNQLSSYASQKT